MKMLNFNDLGAQPSPARVRAGSVVVDLPRAGGRATTSVRVPPGVPADVAIQDWDDLFNAVTARLAQIGACGTRDDAAVRQVRSGVLECAAHLKQLHHTLAHELDRHAQLERDTSHAQIALAYAGAELAGGGRHGQPHAHHLALHDRLTWLPNRRFLHERLDRALAQADRRTPAFALLCLDLDGFKPINDAHGRDAGDELLRIVAVRLSRAVRAEDMVSRLGGDEFACLLNGLLDREQLSRLASKLFDAVSAPLTLGPLRITLVPSIGIAVCPTDGATADVLLKRAGAAKYRAKRQQTGYAFCSGVTCPA